MTSIPAPRTTTETLYEQFKVDIVEGRLAGRLRFNELRDQYGASVGSIREAISRLVPEGLVEFERHRWLRVPALSSADFTDLVAVRSVIEELCLRNAIENGDDEWRARVLTAFNMLEITSRNAITSDPDRPAPDPITRRRQHDAVHEALVSSCTSQRLLWLRQILRNQAERYLAVAFALPLTDDEKTFLHRHAELVNAALEGRADEATKLLLDNLNNAASLALPRIRQIEASQQEADGTS